VVAAAAAVDPRSDLEGLEEACRVILMGQGPVFGPDEVLIPAREVRAMLNLPQALLGAFDRSHQYS
jgi:hypothetical protein